MVSGFNCYQDFAIYMFTWNHLLWRSNRWSSEYSTRGLQKLTVQRFLPNLPSCKFQTKTTAQKTQTIFLTESEQNILARDLVKRESDIKLTVSVGVLLESAGDIQQKDQPWCGLLHQVGLSKGQKSLLLQR